MVVKRTGSASYEVVYVMEDGTTQSFVTRQGAPTPETLFRRRPLGTNDDPRRAVFVIRYMPSIKMWRAYDLRQFREMRIGTGKIVVQTPRVSTTLNTPDREATIMASILRLAG